MAENTITVKPGPKLAPGQVAIWDRDAAHPGGEVFLAKPHTDDAEQGPEIEVAETGAVTQALADGRLARADKRRGRRPAAEEDEADAPAEAPRTARRTMRVEEASETAKE